MIYLDTSAFLKLYVREEGSDAVQQWVSAQDEPLPVWELQQFEFINALRLKVFWGDITVGQSDKLIENFDSRLRRGLYHFPTVDRSELMEDFRTLSRETCRLGCRTMDVMHVACALQLSPERFVTFDDRQRQLALHAGLSVLPREPAARP